MTSDIQVYQNENLVTFAPRTPKAANWIKRNLRPKGWTDAGRGACHADKEEEADINSKLWRAGFIIEKMYLHKKMRDNEITTPNPTTANLLPCP